MALRDKVRFLYEMKHYKGPLKVSKGTPKKKDPSAPKRPISAFLAYSQDKRSEFDAVQPALRAPEISLLLAQKWKEEQPSVREHYTKITSALHEDYRSDVALHKKVRTIELKQKENESVMKALKYAMKGGCSDVVCDVPCSTSYLPVETKTNSAQIQKNEQPSRQTLALVPSLKNTQCNVLRPVKSTGKMPTPVTVSDTSTLPDGVEHDEAFLDDWEPLPFYETPELDDDGFIDGKATPPKTGMNALSPLPWIHTIESNNYWQGNFPTHFLKNGTVLSDGGLETTAIITPEQNPRDVIQLQLCNREALPFTATQANESTSPTCFNDTTSTINGATQTQPSAPFVFLPQELLIDPIYLQHFPRPPDLTIIQMPKCAPPCSFMASPGDSQSIFPAALTAASRPPLDSTPLACVSMSTLDVTNADFDLEDTRLPSSSTDCFVENLNYVEMHNQHDSATL